MSGIDNIHKYSIKEYSTKNDFWFLHTVQNKLNNSYILDKWKVAKVVLLSKKDKKQTGPKNLRYNNMLYKFCIKLKFIAKNNLFLNSNTLL